MNAASPMTCTIPGGSPVRLMWATGPAPVIVDATVTQTSAGPIELRLSEYLDLPRGSRVIVERVGDVNPRHLLCDVTHQAGELVAARRVRIHAEERRVWPRMVGRIDLRYCVASPDTADRWLRDPDAADPQHQPEPFMSFSAGGLAFDDADLAEVGDMLCMRIAVPGIPGSWRCTARVVRVWPLSEDEQDPTWPTTHCVACAFEEIPEDAVSALVQYTWRIQDALLGV